MPKSIGLIVGLAILLGTLAASTAQAAPVTVGQLFVPDTNCSAGDTLLQSGVSSGNTYAIPTPGVVTSWSVQEAATTISGLKLKVARPAGGINFTIVGESSATGQTVNTVNTYPANIPVQPGDIIGIFENGGLV